MNLHSIVNSIVIVNVSSAVLCLAHLVHVHTILIAYYY